MGVTEARSTPSTTRRPTGSARACGPSAWSPDGVDRGASRTTATACHRRAVARRVARRGPRAARALPRRWSRRPRATGATAGGAGGMSDAGHWSRLERRRARRAVDGRHRGGGDAARAARVGPRLALRRGAGGAARGHAGAHRRRDARVGARARDRAARRRRRRRSPSCASCAAGSRDGARAARHARRGRRARTRSRCGRTSRSPPARATSSCYSSMRELARREPTFALHVHVARPDPEAGGARLSTACARTCRCCSRCRPTRRSGRAATPGWPRCARRCSRPSRASASRACSASYADYVEAVDVLLRCDAFPEPTFLWWDVRLQPRFGTLEVRVMDAQTRSSDTAALTALVQCLVRLEAREGTRATRSCRGPRCSRRTASSPRATGWRRAHRPGEPSAGGPRASGSASCSTPARRTPPSSAARPSSRRVRGARGTPGAARQRSRAGRGPTPQLGRADAGAARRLHLGARRAGRARRLSRCAGSRESCGATATPDRERSTA